MLYKSRTRNLAESFRKTFRRTNVTRTNVPTKMRYNVKLLFMEQKYYFQVTEIIYFVFVRSIIEQSSERHHIAVEFTRFRRS